MDGVLDAILRRLVKEGALAVTAAGGQRRICGDGAGAPVAVCFTSYSWQWTVLLDPELCRGEAYRPSITNAWSWKYIFPGGYTPTLSELTPVIERAGFIVTDIEVLRLHYAETLRRWRERFIAQREAALKIFDERFIRMWEFYLAGFEAAFRHQGLTVFQIQLAKTIDAVPLTRDYLYDRAEPADAVATQRAKTPLWLV